jgi:hypothetical protein
MKNIPTEMREFLMDLTHPDILKRPNWSNNLLESFSAIRTKSFGAKNTRGKVFPTVPYDMIKP